MTTTQDLINGLNTDLANEFAAVIQYTVYAAKVTGPARPQLSQFLLAEVTDEQNHAKLLSDKIITLGGEPTTIPAKVTMPETNRGMLEAVLAAEKRAVISYTERAEQATALGLKALALDLEDMIRDETTHSEEIQKILNGWAL